MTNIERAQHLHEMADALDSMFVRQAGTAGGDSILTRIKKLRIRAYALESSGA